MNVAIRADGGPSIGFGHLVRTGAIANECLRRDDKVMYLTTTPDAVSTSLPDSVSVKTLDAVADPKEVLQALDEHAVDTLFLDLFDADTSYQRALCGADVRVVVRHNYLNHTVCCDALVYGDLHASSIDYDWVGSEPEFLLGPDYILLREQFREIATKDSRWQNEPDRALISMGGSDVSNATPAVMKAFSGFDGTVDVVVGPGFSNTEEIEKMASTLDVSFDLLFNPNDMATIMHRTDMAVSAVGGTVFELLATRTPFVGIPEVENQLRRAEALQRRGLAIIGDQRTKLPKYIAELSTTERRKEVYDNMEGLVDGNGAKRVYSSL